MGGINIIIVNGKVCLVHHNTIIISSASENLIIVFNFLFSVRKISGFPQFYSKKKAIAKAGDIDSNVIMV